MRIILMIVIGTVSAFGTEDAWLQLSLEGMRAAKIADYPAAEKNYRAALAEAELLGDADLRLRASLSNLAAVVQEQGKLAEAETLLRRAVGLGEKYSAGEPEMASKLANLAGVLHLQGRGAEADPLLRRALVMAEAGSDLRVSAAVLNTLGLVLREQRQLSRAEPVLRRSLALLEQISGADSLDAAKAMNNLAALYSESGQHAKAQAEMERSLPLYEKHLGGEHPLLATALNNMFSILAEQHRFDEAEPYLRRAIAIGEKSNVGDAAMSRIHESLAVLEFSRGRFGEAARILEDVIAVEERTLGPAHPHLAVTLANYSAVLRRLHQKTEAKRAANRANTILANTLR